MGKTGHRFIGDQKLRLCGHGAGELELAHFHLGEVARQAVRLVVESDLAKESLAPLLDFMGGVMTAAPPRHGIEERDADIVRQGEADEWPRQLKAARQAQMRALMRG